MNNHRLIVALDFYSWSKALEFAEKYLDPKKHIIKIGHKLIFGDIYLLSEGLPRFISKGFKVFLDTKFYEIPSIVGDAIGDLVYNRLWALTIHAQGGKKMIKTAVHASYETNILAVTKLTTCNASKKKIKKLGKRAYNCGANGIICSPADLPLFKNLQFLKVTPGIRLDEQHIDNDDQVRIDTPFNAFKNGATHIVVGRPITEATDPDLVIAEIETQIEEGLKLQHNI